jgi:3-polyprenyl-4-hydroxybenzoate decarboxylase
MAFLDLRDYLAALEKAGELRRIAAEVSPVLETTEIADRVVKRQGPALLFGNVSGSRMPVAINLFGSQARVQRALANLDLQRDLEFATGRAEPRDHASRMPWWGSKVGIDATRKWAQEGFARPWPGAIVMSPEVKARVDTIWKALGIDR